jgi:hypothetical protein
MVDGLGTAEGTPDSDRVHVPLSSHSRSEAPGETRFDRKPIGRTDGRHFESDPTRDPKTLRINRDVSPHSQSGTLGMPSRLAGVVVMGRSARLAIAGSGAVGAVGLSAMYAFAFLQRRVSGLSC